MMLKFVLEWRKSTISLATGPRRKHAVAIGLDIPSARWSVNKTLIDSRGKQFLIQKLTLN